jgi:glycosyltransferase involved in cell wall biosynthesis
VITTSRPIALIDIEDAHHARMTSHGATRRRSQKVALIMVAVSDLVGSGGAEREFSQLQEHFSRCSEPWEVWLITATRSLARLQVTGRLQGTTRVVALDLGDTPGLGKANIAWMTLRLLWITLIRRFDLVHICLPSPIYVPYVAVLSRLPRAVRPRLVLTVIDCTLAVSLEYEPSTGTYERQVLDAHRMFFRWARLDGIFSWYRNVADLMGRRRLTTGHPIVRAARFCFTDPARFQPAAVKQPVVVFAGRLSEQKRPLIFVDAVAQLRAREQETAKGWRFEMYGKGLLEGDVRTQIAHHHLENVITLAHTVDMAPVFARSRLFVSTQALENFTSLAMLEAMAAGNAVVAEDVGQTREFVRHGENGLLTNDPSPDGFASAMLEYMRHPERHEPMAAGSRRLATEVHTVEHFAEDLEAFWGAVAGREAFGSAGRT